VTDKGPGIEDGMKVLIFDRLMKESEKRSSHIPGLHIVKMIIGAYGGRVWAGDQVAGHPEQAAAIRVILKKAL
jgi:K+-sensing histidine kinase KdpD